MGFFEVCNKGTLFFDEITDMPFNLQAKILRATEEKVITRVGDTNQIYTDFRIISATNQDIDKKVEEKKFRLDLLHRLNTLHIHIPALRERPQDIKPLLNHFIDYYSIKFNKPKLHVSKEAVDALMKYSFPGNVRELKNLTERAIILSKGNQLNINDFPVKQQKNFSPENQDDLINLKSYEISLIRKVLQNSKFNQTAAASMLGITRDALNRKMKKYNIVVNKCEEELPFR
jgi:DNA-binding NtrC family response regulator